MRAGRNWKSNKLKKSQIQVVRAILGDFMFNAIYVAYSKS